MDKGAILTLGGIICMAGGLYWYVIDGSMGILIVIVVGMVLMVFAGDRI